MSLYLSIFRLPEKHQNLIWSGEFAYKSFEYLYDKGLLNGNARALQVTDLIDKAAERKLSVDEFQKVVDDYVLELKEKEVEAAKKAAVTIEASRSRVEKRVTA